MTFYPHLFKPLRIRGKDIPNRMVMGAMHTRLETMDRPYTRLAAFYGERARGEIGLILTGGHAPTPEGVMDSESPVLNDESQLEGHRTITQAVHAEGGGSYCKSYMLDVTRESPNALHPRPVRRASMLMRRVRWM